MGWFPPGKVRSTPQSPTDSAHFISLQSTSSSSSPCHYLSLCSRDITLELPQQPPEKYVFSFTHCSLNSLSEVHSQTPDGVTPHYWLPVLLKSFRWRTRPVPAAKPQFIFPASFSLFLALSLTSMPENLPSPFLAFPPGAPFPLFFANPPHHTCSTELRLHLLSSALPQQLPAGIHTPTTPTPCLLVSPPAPRL